MVPYDLVNGDSLGDYVMVPLVENLCYFRIRVWNLRTKLCCIAPGKQNISTDSLQGFYNSYIMC